MRSRESLHPVLRFFVKKKRNGDVSSPVDSTTQETALGAVPGPEGAPPPPAQKPPPFWVRWRKPKSVPDAAAPAVVEPSQPVPQSELEQSEPQKRRPFWARWRKKPAAVVEPAAEVAVPPAAPDEPAPEPESSKKAGLLARFKRKKTEPSSDSLDEADIEEEQVEVVDVRKQIERGLSTRFAVQVGIIVVLVAVWAGLHLLIVLPSTTVQASAERDLQDQNQVFELTQAKVSGLRQQLLALNRQGAERAGALIDRAQWRASLGQIQALAGQNRVSIQSVEDIKDPDVDPNPESVFGVAINVRRVSLSLQADYFSYLTFRRALFNLGLPVELRSERVESQSNTERQSIELVLRAKYL
ncbi:MAG: hypothetical protein ACPGU3_06580 [Litorivicinus sp.]